MRLQNNIFEERKNRNEKGLFRFWYLIMAFFTSAVDVMKTLVIALGAGLGVWGIVNLLEGYGNDNPGANAHDT